MTVGETDSFNYDELTELMSDLHCNKEKLNSTQSLLFLHLLQMYLSNGYVNQDQLNCFQKPTKQKLDTYRYLSKISNDSNEDAQKASERLPILSEVFYDYYKLIKSNKIAQQSMYNTSYGLYFVSYTRAKNALLQNYSAILMNLDYKSIGALEKSKDKENLLAFLKQEIDMVNEVGNKLSETYFESFKKACFNAEGYEFDLFSGCFTNIAFLNNRFHMGMGSNEYDYQYQFLLFSKHLATHYRTMKEGIEKTKHVYLNNGLAEDEIQNAVQSYFQSEIFATTNVYVGSHSFDDKSIFDTESLKKESKKPLNEYYYNLVENNNQRDTLYDKDIIEYVFYKSRYCTNEYRDDELEHFNCYSDIADLLHEINPSVKYNEKIYDSETLEDFWDWYGSYCLLTCDSTLTTKELDSCRIKNASLSSKRESSYLSFYKEKYNGLDNRYCFAALHKLLALQLSFLYENEAFVHLVYDYASQYTQSFIGLTILRADLAIRYSDDKHIDYSMETMSTYFAKIDDVIASDKINAANKKLIVEGVLYRLGVFLDDFTFSEKLDSIKELLQSKIDESQALLNNTK